MKQLYILIFPFAFFSSLSAQQSISSAGGDAAADGYYFTYNIGQIDYMSTEDGNYSLNQGVLQIYYDSTLASNENSAGKNRIYPNPVTENLTVELNPFEKGTPFQLFDGQGRLVKSGTILNEKSTLDLTEFSSGIYILKINAQKKIQTFKIIKN